jgi:ABC-type cobalamin transport system ATPase subunit
VANALLAGPLAGRPLFLIVSDPDLDIMAFAPVSHRHYPYLNLQKNDKATPTNTVTTKASYKTQFVRGFPQLIGGSWGRRTAPEVGEQVVPQLK